jgi:hypothetical protein
MKECLGRLITVIIYYPPCGDCNYFIDGSKMKKKVNKLLRPNLKNKTEKVANCSSPHYGMTIVYNSSNPAQCTSHRPHQLHRQSWQTELLHIIQSFKGFL